MGACRYYYHADGTKSLRPGADSAQEASGSESQKSSVQEADLDFSITVGRGAKRTTVDFDVPVTYEGTAEEVRKAQDIARSVLEEHFEAAVRMTERVMNPGGRPADKSYWQQQKDALKKQGVKVTNPQSVFEFYAYRFAEGSEMYDVMRTRKAADLISKFTVYGKRPSGLPYYRRR